MNLYRCSVPFLLFFTLMPGLCPADTTKQPKSVPKAYSPFDEPRPKIPREITEDKRLDMKVKVFVKSNNMKQLFADLSAKTGVKITAAKELHGERPIIFFHSRPLRDVMTEISGLYGYRWIISGKPGAYEYQLFEDIRHSKRRGEVEKEMKAAQDAVLLDIARKCMEDDGMIDRLGESRDSSYMSMFAPTLKDTNKLFRTIGAGFLEDVLANGNVDCTVGDLPPEWQQAVCDWRNAALERAMEMDRELGREPRNLMPVTPADLASTSFEIMRMGGALGMPSFRLQVMTPMEGGGSSGSTYAWPFRKLNENDVRAAAGLDVPKKVLSDTPLPDEPKITVDKLRLLGFHRALRLGDIFEAIARQSGMDIIADDHLRGENTGAIKDVPLRQVVEMVYDKFQFTCQVEKGTLRFRYNKWYAEPIIVEPPESVIEQLWKTVEEKGRLDMHDLAKLSNLSDEQLKWPGLKTIPGGYEIESRGTTIRFWATLSADQETQMRGEAGLPVVQLSTAQRNRLDEWIADQKAQVSTDDLERSIIRVETGRVDEGWPELGTTELLTLKAPDGKSHQLYCIFPPPLKVDARKELAAQRKADAAAERIELLE